HGEGSAAVSGERAMPRPYERRDEIKLARGDIGRSAQRVYKFRWLAWIVVIDWKSPIKSGAWDEGPRNLRVRLPHSIHAGVVVRGPEMRVARFDDIPVLKRLEIGEGHPRADFEAIIGRDALDVGAVAGDAAAHE